MKTKSPLLKKLTFLFLIGLLFIIIPSPNSVENNYPHKIYELPNTFSEEKLIELITKLNFKFPEIVLAQARLESGYYNSELFLSNSNLFGMRVAGSRITLNQGKKQGYANYTDWRESVIDYSLWYATYAHEYQTQEEFLDLLDRIYAEDGSYKSKLLSIVKEQNLKEKFLKP